MRAQYRGKYAVLRYRDNPESGDTPTLRVWHGPFDSEEAASACAKQTVAETGEIHTVVKVCATFMVKTTVEVIEVVR